MEPDGTFAPARYPPEALKEIIVNAVIHRDYNLSDDILISVFDNRVEVRSPGKLAGHITVDNILDERFSRNPTIVRLLNRFPDPPNKDIGEGLNTVFAKMLEAKLTKPKIVVERDAVTVILGHTPVARPQEIVLEYLETHPEITNSVGRQLCNISSESVMHKVFTSLAAAGRLERVPGKAGNKAAWRLQDVDDATMIAEGDSEDGQIALF
jgi:ATP-dependent DNA helicase RecG